VLTVVLYKLKLMTYALALASVRVAEPRQLDDSVYDPVSVSALAAAPSADIVTLTVTLLTPSNCSNPVPSSAPLTALAVSANPVPVKVYTPDKVLAEQPAG
jgi:hypothetical protein